MTPPSSSPADLADVHQALAAVAYVLDSHDYDRLGEVFAEDVHFENPGRLVADGLAELIAAFKKITDPAISHHITNVVVTELDGTSAGCVSKALALRSGGVLTAAEYRDTLRKEAGGWRITSRHITPLG